MKKEIINITIENLHKVAGIQAHWESKSLVDEGIMIAYPWRKCKTWYSKKTQQKNHPSGCPVGYLGILMLTLFITLLYFGGLVFNGLPLYYLKFRSAIALESFFLLFLRITKLF